ncbi:MAG: transcriptional regulator [Robiginitomaculum sp.]|nr:MAG: transcriptional regulator [Robiginitomaculum sp.]
MSRQAAPDLSNIENRLNRLRQILPPASYNAIHQLALDMSAYGADKSDPIRELMALLGDKWTTLILLVLYSGKFGSSDLKKTITILAAEDKISRRMLTVKLRSLERNGMVLRTTSADIPPRVDYELTSLGQSFTKKAHQTILWIREHFEAISKARKQFDLSDD